jgi:CheY-like chemotaxis protein
MEMRLGRTLSWSKDESEPNTCKEAYREHCIQFAILGCHHLSFTYASQVSCAVPDKTLLCVDDDPNVLKAHKLLLESKGYAVVTASSGTEALHVLTQEPKIDLVIVDYLMPGMNGDEFAERLQQSFPPLPLVVVSGADELPDRFLKKAAGFVSKTQGPEVLLSLITQITQKKDEDPRAKKTVLCVEDDALELTARKKLLEAAGFCVLQAQTPDAAMEVFRSTQVDAVVMDYWLYGNRNGTDLADEMKRARPRTPVLMLSGYGSLPGEGAIVDAWMNKAGINPEELVNEVKRLIEIRQS